MTATVTDPPVDVVDREPRWLIRLVTAAGVLVGLSGLVFLAGDELAPGNDIPGHLQRTSFGIDQLWAQGRLDGWYPGAMVGYQEFLFYGPGFTALVGATRLLGLGLVSDAGALKFVLIATYLVLPFVTARLGRAFGLSPLTAAGAGVLALAAGSTRGGGIDGAFATGLAAQQLAVPLMILALAQITERINSEATVRHTGPLPLAFTVALALTHPLSLTMLAMFTPICLAAVWLRGSFDAAGFRTLVIAAAWTVGLSAWWWVPGLLLRDLRGPVTSFTLPGVWEHVELLANGERGWRGLAGPVAAVGMLAALGEAIANRDRKMLALVVLPVGCFATLHLAHGLMGIESDVGRQLPNRGLVVVAVLTTLAAAVTIVSWTQTLLAAFGARAPGWGVRLLGWAGLAGVAAWSIITLDISAIDRHRPVAAIEEAAEVLRDEVPDHARFAWVEGHSDGYGVPEPQRWLAWKSDRNGTSPFVPEVAPGASVVRVASVGPEGNDVGVWIDWVRDLAVTHIVTANEVDIIPLLVDHPRLDLRFERDGLSIWRIEEEPGKPTGSIIPTPEAELVDHGVNRYVYDVSKPEDGPVTLSLGYSPGWGVEVDGEPIDVDRSADDRVEIDLPAGDHRVSLEFVEPVANPIGRVLAVATALGALAWWWRQRRRRTRSDPVADTGSKSPATARR